MKILISKRFHKAYRKAGFGLRGRAESAVHDFVKFCRSDPKTVVQNYDRLAHLSEQVLEIDFTRGHRITAQYSGGSLVLLDMGGHEIVNRYSPEKLYSDLQSLTPAPPQFWPETKSKLFVSQPDRSIPLYYEKEIASDWLYFLADEQERIQESVVEGIIEEEYRLHLIMGGPGTGKTCILLNILRDLADFGLRVGIHVSPQVVSYIEASTQQNISQYSVNLRSFSPLDVLLVDDPSNIKRLMFFAEKNSARMVAAAFDPLQLAEELTDSELAEIISKYGACQHALTTCYRQKENVGRNAKNIADVIAESTPFIRSDKVEAYQNERRRLTNLSNSMAFINPHGYSQCYPNATVDDVREEAEEILKYEHLLWKHWPGLLIILDRCELKEETWNVLSPLLKRDYVKTVQLSHIEDIKGLEFQNVFIFIQRKLFNELESGFSGTGRPVYNERRLLRIPYSRAKDRIVVFVVDEMS